MVDSISYLPQIDDIAFGRSPNGSGQFTMLSPTFRANNDFPNSAENIVEKIIVFPNPFIDILYLDKRTSIEIRDILGKLIFSKENTNYIKTANWEPGVYFISLTNSQQIIKVIKVK